jgi:hypothetical protein
MDPTLLARYLEDVVCDAHHAASLPGVSTQIHCGEAAIRARPSMWIVLGRAINQDCTIKKGIVYI